MRHTRRRPGCAILAGLDDEAGIHREGHAVPRQGIALSDARWIEVRDAAEEAVLHFTYAARLLEAGGFGSDASQSLLHGVAEFQNSVDPPSD